jgi:hypothetical protein
MGTDGRRGYPCDAPRLTPTRRLKTANLPETNLVGTKLQFQKLTD